jgi:hypothetical protein
LNLPRNDGKLLQYDSKLLWYFNPRNNRFFLSHWHLVVEDGLDGVGVVRNELVDEDHLRHVVVEAAHLKQAMEQQALKNVNNGTEHIRHQCRKTAALGCHRFLISSGV